jgi:membrane-associated protein
MELIQQGIDLIRYLFDETHWDAMANSLGLWLYLVLFAIVFCETGLVVTPILPGDSLLFFVGALASRADSELNILGLLVLLAVAAVAGDAVNYAIGYHVGPRVFTSEKSRLFNKKHLLRTHDFYEKYGGKTIILARFIPIIRTFAPFVAGIAKMEYRQFALFNVSGGIAWVMTFLLGGYYLGSAPFVQRNFKLIIIAIILISVMPAVIEYMLARRRSKAAKPVPAETV